MWVRRVARLALGALAVTALQVGRTGELHMSGRGAGEKGPAVADASKNAQELSMAAAAARGIDLDRKALAEWCAAAVSKVGSAVCTPAGAIMISPFSLIIYAWREVAAFKREAKDESESWKQLTTQKADAAVDLFKQKADAAIGLLKVVVGAYVLDLMGVPVRGLYSRLSGAVTSLFWKPAAIPTSGDRVDAFSRDSTTSKGPVDFSQSGATPTSGGRVDASSLDSATSEGPVGASSSPVVDDSSSPVVDTPTSGDANCSSAVVDAGLVYTAPR